MTSKYHDRVNISEYDEYYRDIPESDLNHHSVSSPFDAWSEVTLRSKFDESIIHKIPTDVMIWGRGEPKIASATKIGGTPVWPQDKPLPFEKKRFGKSNSEMRFLGQFNFMDSLDILPKLPSGMLSIWVEPDYLWEPKHIHAYWIDPNESSPVNIPSSDILAEDIPHTPFYAALYRTWDPQIDQKITPVEIDHKFESYREYTPNLWSASKFGGVETMPQWGSESKNYIFQFHSIQPACGVPYPWINHPAPFDLSFDENGIYNDQNAFIMGDMGAISFSSHRGGKIKALFECG